MEYKFPKVELSGCSSEPMLGDSGEGRSLGIPKTNLGTPLIVTSRKTDNGGLNAKSKSPISKKESHTLRHLRDYFTAETEPPSRGAREIAPSGQASRRECRLIAYEFSYSAFKDNLIERLAYYYPESPAYSFVISSPKGYSSSYATGLFRVSTDQKMTVYQPIQTASVSKMITGAAVLRAIELSGGAIRLSDFIFPFLAALGKPAKKMKLIRFRDCLQYRVGIPGYAGGGGDFNFQAILDWVTKAEHLGSDGNMYQMGDIGTVSYNNVCFTWFRIALFYMTAPKDVQASVAILAALRSSDPKTWATSAWHRVVSLWYQSWIKKHVLQPGTWANLKPVADGYGTGDQTWYYLYPATTGIKRGDDTLIAGGTGWYMSAMHLAAFWHNLSYGTLLSPANRSAIFNSTPTANEPPFILDPGTVKDLAENKPFFKKGGLVGRQASYLMQFARGAQLTFLTNYDLRNGGSSPDLATAIAEAYKKSWAWIDTGKDVPC